MIVEGAFVRTLFPTNERPRQPGLLHICYCLGVAPPLSLVAYTSSQPWPAAMPLPLGVRVFERRQAAALNQRPFVLYLNRLAKLPLTSKWFPAIGTPSRGIIAVAPAAIRDELMAAMIELARRRRDLVATLGP